jgi:hypothetical protein
LHCKCSHKWIRGCTYGGAHLRNIRWRATSNVIRPKLRWNDGAEPRVDCEQQCCTHSQCSFLCLRCLSPSRRTKKCHICSAGRGWHASRTCFVDIVRGPSAVVRCAVRQRGAVPISAPKLRSVSDPPSVVSWRYDIGKNPAPLSPSGTFTLAYSASGAINGGTLYLAPPMDARQGYPFLIVFVFLTRRGPEFRIIHPHLSICGEDEPIVVMGEWQFETVGDEETPDILVVRQTDPDVAPTTLPSIDFSIQGGETIPKSDLVGLVMLSFSGCVGIQGITLSENRGPRVTQFPCQCISEPWAAPIPPSCRCQIGCPRPTCA